MTITNPRTSRDGLKHEFFKNGGVSGHLVVGHKI